MHENIWRHITIFVPAGYHITWVSNMITCRHHKGIVSMEDKIALIQVLDTAIKIGLGALIAGVSGYLVLIRNQQGQKESEYREEKRKYISEVLEAMGYSTNCALDYWKYVHDLELTKRAKKNPSEEFLREMERCGRTFRDSYERLTLLEGKYYLVVGKKSCDRLVIYRTFLSRFFWSSKTGYVENIESWPAEERRMRDEFFEDVRTVYLGG